MKRPTILLTCLALVAVVSITAVRSYERSADSVGAEMARSARALIETLDEEDLARALLPFEGKERTTWNFVPLETRKGLPLGEMSEEQRELTRALLNAALSETGLDKTEAIIRLEGLLRTLEGPDRHWARDPLLYYVTLYGEPSENGRWGMSFEGHHLSLNFVVEGEAVVASTPQFMGANPAEVRTGEIEGLPVGTRVLGAEEKLAFELLASLDEAARSQAAIDTEAPREIRAPKAAQPPQEEAKGLAAGEMSAKQVKQLRSLIEVYTSAMPEPVARQRWEAIENAGFEQVRFAWLGADRPGIGHGYRVQGPTFLIELVNTQPDAEGNPANHVHCVWRDMRGDFGVTIGE